MALIFILFGMLTICLIFSILLNIISFCGWVANMRCMKHKFGHEITPDEVSHYIKNDYLYKEGTDMT